MTASVVALVLLCEACGMSVRINKGDGESFCAFWGSHFLPTVDEAVLSDGRRVEVVTG